MARLEELPEGTRLHGVHGAGLQVHQDGPGHVLSGGALAVGHQRSQGARGTGGQGGTGGWDTGLGVGKQHHGKGYIWNTEDRGTQELRDKEKKTKDTLVGTGIVVTRGHTVEG